MEYSRRRYDGHSLVVQPYFVPYPQMDNAYYHDASLYSLWNFFVEFCSNVNNSNFDEDVKESPHVNRSKRVSYELKFNKFIGRRRLPIFVYLAHGACRDPAQEFHSQSSPISKSNWNIGLIDAKLNRQFM